MPLREEGARAARRSRSRGRYSWGEERVACAHGELSLGGMSEAGPGQGAALSRACGRAAANVIKNPNWLFEAQNHSRADDCVLETHQKAVLDVSPCFDHKLQASSGSGMLDGRTAGESGTAHFCESRGANGTL